MSSFYSVPSPHTLLANQCLVNEYLMNIRVYQNPLKQFLPNKSNGTSKTNMTMQQQTWKQLVNRTHNLEIFDLNDHIWCILQDNTNNTYYFSIQTTTKHTHTHKKNMKLYVIDPDTEENDQCLRNPSIINVPIKMRDRHLYSCLIKLWHSSLESYSSLESWLLPLTVCCVKEFSPGETFKTRFSSTGQWQQIQLIPWAQTQVNLLLNLFEFTHLNPEIWNLLCN